MACCAFAVFLLSQLLLPLERLRAWLFGEKAPLDNPAVAWTFAESSSLAPSPAPRRHRVARAFAIAATAELAFVAGAVALVTNPEPPFAQTQPRMSEADFLDMLHRSICKTFGVAQHADHDAAPTQR
jgi:hypothetical protein